MTDCQSQGRQLAEEDRNHMGRNSVITFIVIFIVREHPWRWRKLFMQTPCLEGYNHSGNDNSVVFDQAFKAILASLQ